MRRAGRWSAIAAVGAAVALLSGCFAPGPSPERTSTPAAQPVAADLEQYYGQVLVWDDCGEGMQCTDATVPLDWDDPAGATASIALVRHPATGGSSQSSGTVASVHCMPSPQSSQTRTWP
jgi:hypothetical protein